VFKKKKRLCIVQLGYEEKKMREWHHALCNVLYSFLFLSVLIKIIFGCDDGKLYWCSVGLDFRILETGFDVGEFSC